MHSACPIYCKPVPLNVVLLLFIVEGANKEFWSLELHTVLTLFLKYSTPTEAKLISDKNVRVWLSTVFTSNE